MAYDRYDRDDRWRGGNERDRDRHGGRGRDEERGFFERAGDEVSSWFGDEEPRRERGDYGRDRDRDGGWFSGGRDEERERSRGRDRDRDEGSAWRPMNWTSSNRDYREDYQRGMEGSSEYRPMAGDYGRRGEEFGPNYGGEKSNDDRRDYGRASEWQRDSYRRTSFAGSSASSNHNDPPYGEWRRRHMDELDRDYDQYRRERQERFESDFSSWRERREGKRGLLGRIREHMEVVGSDGEHVGTVDRIAGDRIILTKSDRDSGGVHHSIGCTMIDEVEDDKVVLEMKAERAKERWRDEEHERALFEREDQGEDGPHTLNRSFSGTYR